MSGYYGAGYWQARNSAGNAQIIQASHAADRAVLLAQASKPSETADATPPVENDATAPDQEN